jgi:cyanophycinase-like exopeptidase
MKAKFLPILLFLGVIFGSSGQVGFVSYFTGDTSDVTRPTEPGVVLMGGSTENDSAMVWWLKKSGGGDVLILRASGSDGYNSYLYSELGQQVNSVETIVFSSRLGSYDPYVIRRLSECEAIWMAGGDQGKYTSYWKNSPVDSLINYLVNVKKVPIGGTSAGMAVLGGAYFNALQGSVSSAEALANPYSSLVSIGRNDFLQMPFLSRVITDTHFDNPDRRGRHFAFLARLYQDSGFAWKGICSEEKTAVCIDSNGIGRVFGNSSATEFAYFSQFHCQAESGPQECSPGNPLTWTSSLGPVLVCKVPGTNSGQNYFDLKDWSSQSGGSWENWSANNGQFSRSSGNLPDCITSVKDSDDQNTFPKLTPNPGKGMFLVQGNRSDVDVKIFDVTGRLVFSKSGVNSGEYISFSSEKSGVFQVYFSYGNALERQRLLVLE